MKTEEIERIAKDFAMQVYPKEPYEDIGQMDLSATRVMRKWNNGLKI